VTVIALPYRQSQFIYNRYAWRVKLSIIFSNALGVSIAGITVFCLVFKQISRWRWLVYAFSGKALLKIVIALPYRQSQFIYNRYAWRVKLSIIFSNALPENESRLSARAYRLLE
jgi:hypothetical protein